MFGIKVGSIDGRKFTVKVSNEKGKFDVFVDGEVRGRGPIVPLPAFTFPDGQGGNVIPVESLGKETSIIIDDFTAEMLDLADDDRELTYDEVKDWIETRWDVLGKAHA